jgi:hypothetical protein
VSYLGRISCPTLAPSAAAPTQDKQVQQILDAHLTDSVLQQAEVRAAVQLVLPLLWKIGSCSRDRLRRVVCRTHDLVCGFFVHFTANGWFGKF